MATRDGFTVPDPRRMIQDVASRSFWPPGTWARIVRVGLLERVSVSADRGADPELSPVLYLLTAPGRFQLYETETARPCQ